MYKLEEQIIKHNILLHRGYSKFVTLLIEDIPILILIENVVS